MARHRQEQGRGHRNARDAGMTPGGLSSAAYGKLLRSAQYRLARFPGTGMDAVGLVSECWMKLHQHWPEPPARGDDAQYQATASVAMQQILIDRQRRHTAEKRGSGATHLTLNEQTMAPAGADEKDLGIDLQRAVRDLSAASPRLARVLMLRVFGGFTNGETAQRTGRSLRSTERDWALARRHMTEFLLA